jgi:plastocyanin
MQAGSRRSRATPGNRAAGEPGEDSGGGGQGGGVALPGSGGNEIAVVPRGTPLSFYNADQAAEIRHTITTCCWPCNGTYVSNHPLADGRWDSGVMGYDAIDKGSASPVGETPNDLRAGTYAYFCRIHPWMRGTFRVK